MSPPALALNQATVRAWDLPRVVEGCAAAGIGGVGLWRDRVAEVGVSRAARLVAAAGLQVTSLCRGGFFDRPGWADANRRALDEAAALGAPVLVLVCGGLPPGSRDLPAARRRVAEGIAALVEPAAARGVRLGIEPLHPVFCADRSVVVTLRQALDLADPLPAETVGVVLDTYQVWWDPEVREQIARAGDRLALVQAADWTLPVPEGALLGRGHVGDGCVDVARLVRGAWEAGYRGPVEVELFSRAVWDAPGEETIRTVVDRHRAAFAGW